MSYKANRIMSLGSDCSIAGTLDALNKQYEVNIREPSPLDWIKNVGEFHSTYSMFSGAFLTSILNKSFSIKTFWNDTKNIFENHTIVTGYDSLQIVHQDLSDKDSFEKMIWRCMTLKKHYEMGGLFMYLLNEVDELYEGKNVVEFINTYLPELTDNCIFLTTTEKSAEVLRSNGYLGVRVDTINKDIPFEDRVQEMVELLKEYNWDEKLGTHVEFQLNK